MNREPVFDRYALERRDVMSPLIRNMGAMLVKGATPVEILKQYMAKGDSPTRGRELNIHFGDIGAAETTRGFLGQISPLGDMVPVMAGVTMSFKMRGEDRVGLVYVGDGATSTGAFHEGINFAAVQRQVDILGLPFDADEFLAQLESEHRVKPEVRQRRSIGFTH